MNQTKIYVGNLSYQTTSESLNEAFGVYGEISELKLIMDRDSGRSKGFAFITFATDQAAKAALELNETMLDGRQIKVNPAKDTREGGDTRGKGGFRKRSHGGGHHARN